MSCPSRPKDLQNPDLKSLGLTRGPRKGCAVYGLGLGLRVKQEGIILNPNLYGATTLEAGQRRVFRPNEEL